jgi:hypothetical protein
VSKTVHCEIDAAGDVIRIFKFAKDARALPAEAVREYPKAYAVEQIRRFVFERSKDMDGVSCCEFCGASLTWESGHMHERHAKGKQIDGVFGEVSRANSCFICSGCHTERPDSAHGDRRWQSAKVNHAQFA